MTTCHANRFRLVRLKREELIVQCKHDDYDVWGAPDLTLTEYQAEEILQRRTIHSQRGLIVWGLVERTPGDDKNDPMNDDELVAGRDPIVCHCENHRFDCLLRKPNGEVMRGFSFHVNAVYTLPAYRKQGLAKYFLKEVTRQLSWQEHAIASVLFSDVGPTFYARLGWEVYRSTEVVINVVASQHVAGLEVDTLDVVPLFLDQDLNVLLAREHSRLQNDLEQREENHEVFVPLPTRECLEWQFCSGVFHACVRQYPQSPTQCGAQVADGVHAFILWSHDFRASVLFILYMSIPEQDAGIGLRLLRAAIDEAHRFGLRHIKLWDPPTMLMHPLVTQHVSMVFGDRHDALSSLMIFKHVREDPNANVRPKWLHNERFAWV